ncbi:MAG: N-formylglutamate deformylase [Sneathiella sp.]
MSDIYDLTAGNSPLILSQPHGGINLPPNMAIRMTEDALKLPDTDWHMQQLYSGIAQQLDATVISARYSRFVVDLNRNPDGSSLYPGQDVTELCPTSLFDETPIYRSGKAPIRAEVEGRRETFWMPYHDELQAQINRIHKKFGYVILYDCHSIRSVVPRFFEGCLPDLNLGSADGTSSNPNMVDGLKGILSGSSYSHILNGRFKGGFITRNYGDPKNNIHALQMEIAQLTYMHEEHPFHYDAPRAEKLQSILLEILSALLLWGSQTYGEN